MRKLKNNDGIKVTYDTYTGFATAKYNKKTYKLVGYNALREAEEYLSKGHIADGLINAIMSKQKLNPEHYYHHIIISDEHKQDIIAIKCVENTIYIDSEIKEK